MKFINVGFGNMVASDRIVALASPDSAPIKRLIQDAKDAGRTIDVSCGRRTRSVIITDSEHVILSAIQTETIANRLEGGDNGVDEEEEDVLLVEFNDVIEDWIIEKLQNIGCDTAKSVLALSAEDIAKRADLEDETVEEVLDILRAEFEDEE